MIARDIYDALLFTGGLSISFVIGFLVSEATTPRWGRLWRR